MSIYINGKHLATTEDFGKNFSNIFKSSDSQFDLNNLVNNTIYANEFVPDNAPDGVSQWCFYQSIGFNEVQVQFAIEALKSGKIYMRVKNGLPASWGDWSIVFQSNTDISNLDRRITALEKKFGGVNNYYYLPYLKEVVA